MNADDIRTMDMWQKQFSETMLREIAAQLAEIHQFLTETLGADQRPETKATAEPEPEPKPEPKPKPEPGPLKPPRPKAQHAKWEHIK